MMIPIRSSRIVSRLASRLQKASRRNHSILANKSAAANTFIFSHQSTEDQHRFELQNQQRRWFAGSNQQSGKGPQPRKRFYKQVGVTTVPPPWESRFAADANNKKDKKDDNSVENPISAGVDGTQSASGVIGHVKNNGATKQQQNGGSVVDNMIIQALSQQEQMNRLKQRLIPRCTTLAMPVDNTDHGDQEWYTVTLDGRALRTPIGQPLALPSQYLAWAIAAEWDAQSSHIRPVQMPLMTLACTALDQTCQNMQQYQETALNFLPTDTTCYWADPTEDRILHRHQEAAWKELHDFIEDELQEKPAMAQGAQEGMLMSQRRNPETGMRGLPHPPSLYDACVTWTQNLDAWHLTALNAVTSETKSFLVAYAVLHPASPFSSHEDRDKQAVSKAIRAARVEEEFQIESWGLVEGQHDYDRLNCSVQVRSAKLLAKCVLE